MTRSIVIRGTGLVTPLGGSAASTWENLLAGKSIVGHSRAALGVASPARVPRVTQLALAAAREAMEQASWTDRQGASDRTALLVGTSKGAVSALLASAQPAALPANGSGFSGLHTIASEVSSGLKFTGRGPRLTHSAACATGLIALIRAAMLIEQGDADRALVVASESSLHPMLVQSYRRLGVLAGEGERTRPFDVNRSGFFVSEAAAAVCLEQSEPVPGDVMIQSYALSADAFHLTGTDPNASALRNCLDRVIGGRAIDLVHAHGTATVLNDPIELAALEASLGESSPPPILFSHKAALGHSMGAAGLAAVVLNCMAHRVGKVPPNINTAAPMKTSRVFLSSAALDRHVRQSLAVAAGFGGAIAAVGCNS